MKDSRIHMRSAHRTSAHLTGSSDNLMSHLGLPIPSSTLGRDYSGFNLSYELTYFNPVRDKNKGSRHLKGL